MPPGNPGVVPPGNRGRMVKKNPSKLCLHIPAPSGGTHCQPLRASRAGVPASIYGVATRESILRILNHPWVLCVGDYFNGLWPGSIYLGI